MFKQNFVLLGSKYHLINHFTKKLSINIWKWFFIVIDHLSHEKWWLESSHHEKVGDPKLIFKTKEHFIIDLNKLVGQICDDFVAKLLKGHWILLQYNIKQIKEIINVLTCLHLKGCRVCLPNELVCKYFAVQLAFVLKAISLVFRNHNLHQLLQLV